MSDSAAQDIVDEAHDWWTTDIIDVHPGSIELRGYPVQELIGNVGFVDTIWLMIRGELPSRGQAALLEAALVSSVDHGPQAPSIAIARMATTCGARINGAMASAINVLDDVHGGPGQQCMELYYEIDAELGDASRPSAARSRTPSAKAARSESP
jgi:citrate synthase